ncbi:MAG: type II secretion system protein GspF [Bdellovibrionales bacterium RIFOXYD12_FULL_39_22]|nr:MAG: type II secretion system protein GspF [Bdellovibrionales bacterium RIFOXYB1_FULL_39_21]OFZ41277.1 MAG: type II secretion system protein GspF [Bdellovibrionales bacterium RIFOXYC12_FULL_39_17]OFZ45073.1 MAG: type II secretion system protein GspF [Bdellovibrionales bacterium RIFOXYC1_FULL_39_130]OFZ74457.1 MAG: type II secretion system protein GspF [Bdellovibrionales bacterium RIFOXYD1_FULL_39_84]OFZ92469.1 MAG: type II secretion system protein GspF [Bdellovibrionales bacterium RIFOXYD12_
MAMYKYKGIDKSGKEIRAAINAETESQAKQKVRALGVMITEIREQKTDNLKEKKTIRLSNSVSTSDLSLMTRQLATLVKARIQIVEALNALMEQTSNPQMRLILSEAKQKVNAGSSLAKALADYPSTFSNIYVNMVEAGEASGNLSLVLMKLAEFTENQVKLQNKIKSSMTYPVIMMIFGSLMMAIIFVFVIPKITRVFISMKKELPTQTKIAIWISDFLVNYWHVSLLGLFAAYFLFKKYIKTKDGEKKWHSFLLGAPIVGELIVMINVSRFCSTLATLLSSGVPILVAMKIVKNLVSNVHMQKAIENARINVSEGASLAVPLAKSGLFPPMVTHMITLGERSGELEPMLHIVAENYNDEVNTKLSGLTSVIEPIMMVGMGVAVAFIVFSVVGPMMEMNSLKR